MATNDMLLFLAITIQTGHCMKQSEGVLGNSVIHDWYFHIIHLLSFSNNNKELDMGNKSYDRLWKVGILSDILNGVFAKFCNCSEHLVVDEVTLKFKDWVIFRHYRPRNQTFQYQNLQTLLHDRLDIRHEGLSSWRLPDCRWWTDSNTHNWEIP
jgi:hypothetical protein